MTTNDVYVNVSAKRLLGTDDFGDRLLDYMIDAVRDANRRNFDVDMVHATALTLSSSGNDQFDIDGTSIASDGDGHFLDPAGATHEDINFENQTGFDYYVGLEYSEEPDDVQINPRTGAPEYIGYKEQIGKQGDPDAVVDNTTTITFTIDSVTEAGRTHAGRTAVVYLKTPAAGGTTAAIAIETCTVAWSGGANKITTTGTLGQTTVSTTASDYEVIVLGPTVSRGTDLRTVSGVAFIGIITGNGPGATPVGFDISDQKVVPQSWASALADGLSQDFYPSADATYKLGTSSLRWSEIHTADLLVSNSFLPASDNAVDLGSTTGPKRWRDLHLSRDAVIEGTATITKLDVSAAASEGVVSDLLPDAGDSYDLGSSTRRWKNIYGHGYSGDRLLAVAIATGTSTAIQGVSRGVGIGGLFRGGDGALTTTDGGVGVYAYGGDTDVGNDGGVGVYSEGGEADTGMGGHGVVGIGGVSNTSTNAGVGVLGEGGDASGGGGSSIGGTGVWGKGGPYHGIGVKGEGREGGEGGYFVGGSTDANGLYAIGGGSAGYGIRAYGATGATSGTAAAGVYGEGATATSGDVAGGTGTFGYGGDGYGTNKNGGDGLSGLGGDSTGSGTPGAGVYAKGGNGGVTQYGGRGGSFTGGDVSAGGTWGGIGIFAQGGLNSSSQMGIGAYFVSTHDYCLVLDSGGSNTVRAPLHIVPGSTTTSSPQNGDIRYTTANGFEGRHGGSWITL